MPSHSLDVLAHLSPQVPAALAARADAWRIGDVGVEPALSASVILLRDGPDGLETYLLHRHASMPFAASMVVFPGGRVDAVDTLHGVALLADALHGDAVRGCALRETCEETDVVLADADLMDWAHWTTPVPEPRRYDTQFFVAALPAGQRACDVSGETERAAWSTPAAALQEFGRGDIGLMPPTYSMLLELADVPDLAAVRELARDRTVEQVLPRLVKTDVGWTFGYPVRR